jgi:Cu+-exporting ATPase
MFTLALGVGVAWAHSVVATIAPGIFPPSFRLPDGSVHVLEAAAVIVASSSVGAGVARAQPDGAAIRACSGCRQTGRRVRRRIG